jgi:hyperosmotically inducible protein
MKTLALAAIAISALPANTTTQSWTETKIRKELVTMPFLSIYDDLSFSVNEGTVTLSGAVIRPTLKSQAEKLARNVEGVRQVVNNIEVLPLSPFDDSIRIRTARAIYGYGPMQRYALGANPSIRIIVKNGNVTLQGVVANEMDKNIAGIRANGVSGAFSVTNNLRVSRS